MQEIDLSTMGYEEFVRFFFDREVDYFHKGKRVWKDYTFITPNQQPLALIQHFTILCNRLSELVPIFSEAQINQALWSIIHYPVEAAPLLMSAEISPFYRNNCIRAMHQVFQDVVQKVEPDEPLENSFFLWWRIFARAFCRSQGHESDDILYPRTSVAQETHDIFFETIRRVSSLDHLRCQLSALYGLGCLHHPKGAVLVQRFINLNKELFDKKSLKWLTDCRDGYVS